MDDFSDMDWEKYFKERLELDKGRKILPLRTKQCGDCPVNDMYRPFSEGLKTLSEETQLAVSQRWGCHNGFYQACRGNAEFLGINWSVQNTK